MAREIATLLLFAMLAVAMTWPLARDLRRSISDPGDPYFTTWTLDWDYYATTNHLPLFQANIFAPTKYALAFSEHMYGIALLCFPLFAAGVAPLTIHNIALLAGFAACGYAMFLLARSMVGSYPAAILAGVAYAFVGFRFHHLPHLHFVWSCGLPLVLLAVVKVFQRQTPATVSSLILALMFNGLTSLHWWAFGTFAGAVIAVGLGISQGRGRRFWLSMLGAFTAATILLLPWLLPYAKVTQLYGLKRYFADVLPNSGEWSDWLSPNLQSALYGRYSAAVLYQHERTLFPGFMTFILALLGIALGRARRTPHDEATVRQSYNSAVFGRPRAFHRALWLVSGLSAAAAAVGQVLGVVRWSVQGLTILAYTGPNLPLLILAGSLYVQWALHEFARPIARRTPLPVIAGVTWLVIGAWGARGVKGALHSILFDYVAPYRGIRMPTRWAMVAYVGAALLSAVGAAAILRGRDKALQVILTVVLGIAMLVELKAGPLRWYLVPLEPRPLYNWVAGAGLSGSVLELPITQEAAYQYLWRSTVHHRPLVNGVSSWEPPEYARLTEMYKSDIIPDAFVQHLEDLHCSVVIVHGGWLRDRNAAVREWLRREVGLGRLRFIRRFDAGTRADYVFAVTAVEANVRLLQAPEIRDPSGRTPAENVDVFIDSDQPTYCSEPFASVDVMPRGVVRGPLTVSGWALAPGGVSKVRVLIASGTHSVEARRSDRADVRAIWPWYPGNPLPGFAATIDGPLPSARGPVDLQIELTDGSGQTRRLPPYFFTWKPAVKGDPVWNEQELDSLLARLQLDTVGVRSQLVSRTAAIQDVVAPILVGTEQETDEAFVRRVIPLLLNKAPEPELRSPYLKSLADGMSRERVVYAILVSEEFARMYLVSGRVVID